MTTKKRKRIHPAKLPYGSNAQKFKDLLEIGFETMAYELPMSLEDYGGAKFMGPADDGEIGFGTCHGNRARRRACPSGSTNEMR